MPYVYYVDNGVLFKMTVNQSMVQLVADVTAAAAVTGRLVMCCHLQHLSLTQYKRNVSGHIQVTYSKVALHEL